MFHARKRLLRFGAAVLDRKACVKLPCSFNLRYRQTFITEHPCSCGNQVSLFFVRQASSDSVEALSQKSAVPPESEVSKGVHGINENSWGVPTENELRHLLPLSISVVLSVLKRPLTLECALSFLSWASKQPGFTPCIDEVNEIADLWASKYAQSLPAVLDGSFNLDCSILSGVTWATLMTTSNFLNEPDLTVRIFTESHKHGCVVSQLLYDPLLFALMKLQRVDAVLLTMQEMLASKILPGEKVLGTVFDALCRAGKAKDVYKWVQDVAQLSSTSFRDSAYSRLISAVWRTANSSMALDLLTEMKREGYTPDRQAYEACVRLLCKKQRFDLARSLLKNMRERGCFPDMITCTVLVNGLEKVGKAKQALEVIDLLRNEGTPLDFKMRTAFLSCLFSVGRVDDAIKEFEQMQRDSDSEDSVLYYVVIKKLCEIGDAKRAFDFKKTMDEKGFEADARLYQALQRLLCAGSSFVNELLLLAEEAKDKGHSPIAESYRTLVTHFCSIKDFDSARKWAEEMVSKGYKPTPYIKTRFPELQDVFKDG